MFHFLTSLFQKITSITINDENAAYRDFIKKLNEGWVKDAFFKMLMWQPRNRSWSCWRLGGSLGGQGGRCFWKTRLGKQQEAAEWGEEERSECNQTVSSWDYFGILGFKPLFFSRLIPRKKSQSNNDEMPTHLDMTVRNLIFQFDI